MTAPDFLQAFDGAVLPDEPLAKHTTFRVGGASDWFLVPNNADALVSAYLSCTEQGIPAFLLGMGSNVLFGDRGFRGVVLSTERLTSIRLHNDTQVYAEAGASLKDVCVFARDNGLSGLEFACGIPGSIGGAVYMNAGAYDGEMKNCVYAVSVLRADGSQIEISQCDMDFGYRTSLVQREGGIILGAVFQLERGDKDKIASKMSELDTSRAAKQPLELPSAGSTFKRPEGYFAGKLIMDAGLRGFSVGGARVSEKHCGFVVNTGNATAADILNLIEHVRQTVHAQFGVWLEPEIRLIGE